MPDQYAPSGQIRLKTSYSCESLGMPDRLREARGRAGDDSRASGGTGGLRLSHWSELIADTIAAGARMAEVRGDLYLKPPARTTWQLASWLTHAANAVRYDGLLAVDATYAVLNACGAALLRDLHPAPDRCSRCNSVRVRVIDDPESLPVQRAAAWSGSPRRNQVSGQKLTNAIPNPPCITDSLMLATALLRTSFDVSTMLFLRGLFSVAVVLCRIRFSTKSRAAKSETVSAISVTGWRWTESKHPTLVANLSSCRFHSRPAREDSRIFLFSPAEERCRVAAKVWRDNRSMTRYKFTNSVETPLRATKPASG